MVGGLHVIMAFPMSITSVSSVCVSQVMTFRLLHQRYGIWSSTIVYQPLYQSMHQLSPFYIHIKQVGSNRKIQTIKVNGHSCRQWFKYSLLYICQVGGIQQKSSDNKGQGQLMQCMVIIFPFSCKSASTIGIFIYHWFVHQQNPLASHNLHICHHAH